MIPSSGYSSLYPVYAYDTEFRLLITLPRLRLLYQVLFTLPVYTHDTVSSYSLLYPSTLSTELRLLFTLLVYTLDTLFKLLFTLPVYTYDTEFKFLFTLPVYTYDIKFRLFFLAKYRTPIKGRIQ
jgi:hypothetical protein